MAVKIEGLESPRHWNEFVGACAGGTLYHHSTWLDVIASTYGFRPFLLTLEDSAGELCGILPLFLVESRITGRRLISLPYTNAAGPLCRPGIDSTPLLEAAIDLARREACRYLEIRGQPGQSSLNCVGLQRLDYYGTFILDLDAGVARTRAGFDKRARRGIAKAAKSGVRIRFGDDMQVVREFYRLNLLTRRKHGVPPQPFSFFENLWTDLRPRGGIEIVLAEYEGRTVAGVVLLAFHDTVVYAYGASDQGFLRYAPNHALFDAAIAWSAERGYRHFDFGRTAPENEGLMEFKQQWGANFVDLPYYHWPERSGFVTESENGLKHRLFTAIWRRLPLLATTLLGPPMYRHLA
jgi:CelD/BcsL family acetyltransferase involved in cellulose biosynthesis